MKYARFAMQDHEEGFGVLGDDGLIRVHAGNLFGGSAPTGRTLPLAAVRLLPPCAPRAMIALWNNSRSQIDKLGRETPREALYFLKPATCLATHGDPILYPVGRSERVVLEGEIGIVIGRLCRNIEPEAAPNHIFGYTVVNDVTAQDVVKRDASFPQYTRAKGFDSFGIFGPVIETEVDPLVLRIQSAVNGRICQDYPVTDLALDPWGIVASISRTMTLVPGDVIACGTSLGADPIRPGDTVEIRIPGIGALVNQVVAA